MALKYAIIRFFRSYFTPMNPVTAEKWYRRAKIAYLFTAFQIAGYAIYLGQKNKFTSKSYEIEEPYYEKLIRVMELDNVKVINVGLSGKQDEFFTSKAQVEEKYNKNKAIVYDKYVV